MKNIFFIFFLAMFFLNTIPLYAQVTEDKALAIAEASKEVLALKALLDEAQKLCLKAQVMRPCETDYVTCIDEAWVVIYKFKEDCQFSLDERLGIYLLIDEFSGRIISRFPEYQYFRQKQYCLQSEDCEYVSEAKECLNFIHVALGEGEQEHQGGYQTCTCLNGQCELDYRVEATIQEQ